MARAFVYGSTTRIKELSKSLDKWCRLTENNLFSFLLQQFQGEICYLIGLLLL